MIALKCILPESWRLVPLSELCEINPPKPKYFKRSMDALTTFIPMEAVDDKTGKVVTPRLRQYSMVSHGYTYLEEGDIIFAKITPCMQNGKTAIASGLVDGIAFGSTEFHVLRAKSGIAPEWIYLLLRSAEFRKIAEENFEGSAGQRRISDHFLREIHVPIVEDTNEQGRLAGDTFQRMELYYTMRLTSEKQLGASTAMEQAFLQPLFPFDDVKNPPSGWSVQPLRDLRKSIEYGLSKSATKISAGPKFLRITDIQNGEVNWDSVPYCECSATEAVSCKLEDGDILFARTGATTGKSYLINNPPNAVFASYLIRVQCNTECVLPEYLYAYFQSKTYWQAIGKDSRGGAQAGFNATMLGDLLIPLPPKKDDQINIVTEYRKRGAMAQRIKGAASRQLEAISALPAATLREFFNFGGNANA